MKFKNRKLGDIKLGDRKLKDRKLENRKLGDLKLKERGGFGLQEVRLPGMGTGMGTGMGKRTHKGRRLWAAPLLAAVLFLSACGGFSADGQAGSGKWRVSDVAGTVKAGDEIRLQDDFAAAANKDLLVDAKVGSGSFEEVADAVLAKKKALLEGDLPQGTPRELKKYADLAADWDTRNEDGAEPLQPYLQAIESISSIEELTAYECDRQMNPFCLGVLMPLQTGQSGVDPAVCTMYIGFPELSLGSEEQYVSLDNNGLEKREALNRLAEQVLSKLGYRKEKIRAILKANYRFEKKLAHATTLLTDDEKTSTLMNREDCIHAADSYPLGEILDSWGCPADGSYTINPTEAKKGAALYREGNLEEIKGMLAVHLVTKSARYLDRETFDLLSDPGDRRLSKKKETIPSTEEEMEAEILFGRYLGEGMAGVILDRMYVEAYAEEKTIKDVSELTQDILAQFRILIESEAWLSEEGKEACLAKLDALKPHVIVPDFDMLDDSGFRILSREEGGNFLQAAAASQLCLFQSQTGLCRLPYDRSLWNPAGSSTTETNAFYSCTDNGIYILQGILEAPIYSPDMSYEQKLGGIGAIIGHEITHGFDKNGSEYNKDGNPESWLPFNDSLNFSDRCDRVAEYYRTIRPFPGGAAYDGARVTAEATADMGGLRITLALAAKKEGFDYDAYFRQFARLWFTCVPEDYAVSSFDSDEHPLHYLRANIGVQQFDEFMEAYGVTKEDNMYLMEEKRIAVW